MEFENCDGGDLRADGFGGETFLQADDKDGRVGQVQAVWKTVRESAHNKQTHFAWNRKETHLQKKAKKKRTMWMRIRLCLRVLLR